MTDYYQIKMLITCRTDTEDHISKIVEYIQRWLVGKYGAPRVDAIIADWSKFVIGDTFGDETEKGSFFAETVSCESQNYREYSELWNVFWAGRIVEFPKHNIKYVPRKWITEIGYQPVSSNSFMVSYSVRYEDLLETNLKLQAKPHWGVPNVLKWIVANEEWTCSLDGKTINLGALHQQTQSECQMFGIEECYAMVHINDKNTDMDIAKVEEHMDNHWISLCKVNRPDKKQDIWMQRLADSINGKLIAPVIDDDKEKIFENRPLIFHQDGPDIPDSIGFWEWSEVQMDQDRWYTDANYIEDTVPVEIIMHNNSLSLEELIDELREGITIPSYIRSQLMLAIKVNGHVEGVLCDFENFVVSIGNDTFIKIKEGVYSLPCYILEESDIFTWRNRKIYKHISLGEPQRQVSVFVIGEAIKQMLLQRMSWPVFKAQGISKNDWSKIKQFISAIAKDTIPEKLSKIYNISTQDALRYIDVFMQRVAEYVDAEDVDSAIIVQILENHGKLRESCTEKAYERWLVEHKEEIDKAQLEVSEVYDQAKERLSAIEASLLESQKALEAAEEKREKALADVLTAERKLGELTLKIEKYEVLEQAAISAVRNKIADAQKDMARFIADISIFMPQQVTTANDQRGTRWSYTGAVQDAYPEHEIELAESWEDEVSTISQNLLSSLDVPREMCSMLAAFLYSAHINNTPLIITGPGGGEISKLMAISLYAEDAGCLVLGNGYDENIAASFNDVKEHIIMIKNMFGEGWSDELPQDFAKSKKHIIWTRPYVDDMTIEPKSLYNYMIPVISEYIVGSLADFDPWPGKRADKFKHLASEKTTPLRLAGFKKLGLGRMFILQLERVLSDAKTIIASTAKDKDLELLFGLLPFCVVCGRTDIIKDAIENDNGISSFAKAEAKRFIEDE